MARRARIFAVVTAAAIVAVLAGTPAALLVVTTAVAAGRLLPRRRADVRAQRRRLSMAERTAILDRDGWACVWCGSTTDLELDHVIPWSRGGACSATNLQTLCRRCNRAKGAN